MHGALGRVFVAFVTVAFLGGTLERSALGLTPADPCPLSSHTHLMAHEPLRAGHEHHGPGKQQEPAKHQGAKCFCYGMTGFNVVPAPVSDIAFQTTPISFTVILKTYTGRPVILDPGIPKRIA